MILRLFQVIWAIPHMIISLILMILSPLSYIIFGSFSKLLITYIDFIDDILKYQQNEKN